MERSGTECQAQEQDVQGNRLVLEREGQGNPCVSQKAQGSSRGDSRDRCEDGLKSHWKQGGLKLLIEWRQQSKFCESKLCPKRRQKKKTRSWNKCWEMSCRLSTCYQAGVWGPLRLVQICITLSCTRILRRKNKGLQWSLPTLMPWICLCKSKHQNTCSGQKTHTLESNKIKRICKCIRSQTKWGTCSKYVFKGLDSEMRRFSILNK